MNTAETMNEVNNNANNTTVADNTGASDITMTPGPTPIELKEEAGAGAESAGAEINEEDKKNFAQEMTEAMYNVHATVNEAVAENRDMDTDTTDNTTTATDTDTIAAPSLSPQVVKEQIKYCQRILKGLKRHREAGPFLLPVDPVALNIPDYLTVIKQPMDLSTISKKLDLNEYATAEAFMADVRLMLNNCFTYNAPDSQVTKMGRNLEKYFNTAMAKMNSEIAGGNAAAAAGVSAGSIVEAPSASRPKRESVSVSASGNGAGAQMRRASSPAGSLTYCNTVLRELMKKGNAHLNWPFMVPVDPVALNIPDYFEVIKQPMDLGTIRKKFDTGMYGNADAFVADVRLVFSNCYTYNPADSDVCRMARELEALFEQKMAQKPTPAPKTHNHSAASSAGSSAASLSSHAAAASHTHHNHQPHQQQHFIPSSASQLIPGLDALEDDSEKILAINHQIQILQAELNYLLLNRKSGSSTSIRSDSGSVGKLPAKPKKKAPAAPSALNSAGGGNSVNSSVNASANSKMNEEMSFEEKRQLSEDVSNLPQENMMRVLEIIQECMPNLHSNGDSDVIELDIEALDLRTLRTLQTYIWNCMNPGKKRKPASANAGAKAPKKNKPEESANIAVPAASAAAAGPYDSSSSSSSEDDD